jgi:ParB family chromosome partitioning protein
MKRKALGKGLSSLIPASIARMPAPTASPVPAFPTELRLEVSKIRPNPRQPRHSFDEAGLDELARSLRTQGLLQPVVVRPLADGRFELIAGERRWRAAQRAGIHRIPAVVRDVPDENLLELALIENLQREELNAIEEAEAYRILIDDLELTQNEVAERVGKQRTTVANALRLLNLPEAVKTMLRDESFPWVTRARCLRLRTRRRMSRWPSRGGGGTVGPPGRVRGETPSSTKPRPGADTPVDPNVAAAETTLQARARDEGAHRRERHQGRVEIHYHSADELDRVYRMLVDAGAVTLTLMPTELVCGRHLVCGRQNSRPSRQRRQYRRPATRRR